MADLSTSVSPTCQIPRPSSTRCLVGGLSIRRKETSARTIVDHTRSTQDLSRQLQDHLPVHCGAPVLRGVSSECHSRLASYTPFTLIIHDMAIVIPLEDTTLFLFFLLLLSVPGVADHGPPKCPVVRCS